MDAILLAGGVPAPESTLYPYTLGQPKAALEIGGKPMIQWVLDALEKSPSIGRIVLVGAQELQGNLCSSKILAFLPAGDDILDNFQRGADALLADRPALRMVAVVSSDIPLATSEGIEWVIRAAQETEKDITYCVIKQNQMEERFPESARSYVKLKDMNVCGGDLSVINMDLYKTREDFWRKIFAARKSAMRQASLIGFDILILLALKQLTLEDTVKKVTRRLGISGQGLVCPYPGIGMDIDKPHQLELARRELS
jgi:GTP:adenosylcobinamide-phosphate guanylyltransferase